MLFFLLFKVFFHGDHRKALEEAFRQSKTTHQGEEAGECCRLLAHIIVRAIASDASSPAARKEEVLGALGSGSDGDFSSELYSVSCLAASASEERCAENEGLDLKDRRWEWRKKGHDEKGGFMYCSSRALSDPEYVGSYAMDALAMALHCAWATDCLEEAMLKAANMRGDADTVCAIAGQIAGAVYGAAAIPTDWLAAVRKWDPNDTIETRACMLYLRGKKRK